ncbi:MAG: tetratricopeptide repeat protein, partial [Muribaculaceae bacterium]|nr:tetratricopeptide repeat protein [Muribaculaceae bacterium]
YMNKADDLVRRYVDNPEKNPLDRPTIDHTATNVTTRKKTPSTEDDNEVMNKFNQLVTSGNVSEPRLSYNEKIKGRVQDRNLQVMPEPLYALSFNAPPVSLRALSNYFRALDNFNQRRYYTKPIHLVAGTPSPASEELIGRAFEMEQELTQAIDKGDARPVDYLCRGIVRTMLKNYPDAITDFDKAMENDPDFIVALMGRGYARWMNSTSSGMYPESPSAEGMPLAGSRDAALAVQDYDHALKLDPKLVYAWFNKGVIFYTEGDFTSALQCFSEAIAIDPDFGQAYYNRGLCFLKAGNSRQAFSDLSKAGELGIIPSYNLLKRLKSPFLKISGS